MELELRPVTGDDARVLQAMTAQPEIRRWGWDTIEDPGATRFTIVVDGAVAGMVQYSEEPDPDYRHAWIDVFLDGDHTGRGIGTEAVRRTVETVFGRGHHRVTIDPAADNHRAIRSYEKAGFRRVGILEAAWRDPDGEWRDVMLMEQVRRQPQKHPRGSSPTSASSGPTSAAGGASS